ncbi:MAG TPA: glucose-6-phosphate isomerase family protein [Candidatus Paceibacterota bacterium]|nr:glucose-6-phosphate isomerase family protein [Candidatus Paceibacterota bacterium]
MANRLATRPHEKMRDVLLYPDAPGPIDHYYMIRGGTDMRNVTVMEVGTVGGEYIKTYGHYHIGDLQETYWFAFGEGMVLKQKLVEENGAPQPDRVAEFIARKVRRGDSEHMPPGYGHLILNTGKTYMVTLDDSPVDFGDRDPVSMPGHADYEMVKKMRGFAYYVVERDGAPALVRNPLYKEIQKEDLGGLPVVEA